MNLWKNLKSLGFIGINNKSLIKIYSNNFWKLKSNQKVKVKQLNDEFVVVVGINFYGYLKVKSLSNGQIYYLQPDGNRFDMMENMIVLRTWI